jgi:hypothetical protein
MEVQTKTSDWATGREIYVGCERGKAMKTGNKSKHLKQIEIEAKAEKCTRRIERYCERKKRKEIT